jgi:hypothetical protein
MRYLLWLTVATVVVTVLWLYRTWHKMDPMQGLARSTRREPTPIRRLHPHVRQEIEEQVGDFA